MLRDVANFLRGALAFRGDDVRAPTLGQWLFFFGALGLLAWALSASAPLLGLIWVGLGLAILIPLALTWGRTRFARTVWGRARRYETLLAAGALTVGAIVVFGEVAARGHVVDTKDHHIMIERTRELGKALWSGEIQHYTHYLQGGDALWDLYPVLPNLLVILVAKIVPDGISFEQSYSLVVCFSWWLRGFAVYSLSRRAAGVVPAALVTTAALLDVGEGVWHGNWAATIHWGLVHSSLGISWAGLAFAYQMDGLSKRGMAPVWRTAVCTLLSLLSHPISLFYLGVGGLCLLSATIWRRISFRRTSRMLFGFALGGLLSAWYVLPYMSALRTLGVRFPWPGETSLTLGSGLLDGTVPSGDFGGFYGLALVACCAGLSSRAEKRPSVALCVRSQSMAALVLFCLILAPFTLHTQLWELVPPLRGLQPGRLFMVLKVSLAPIVAWAVGKAWSHLRVPGSLRLLPTLLRAFVLVFLVGGVGRSLQDGLRALQTKLRDQVTTTTWTDPPPPHGAGVDDHLQAAMDWVAATRRADPSATPYRLLALWGGIDSWGLWWFPWRTGVPLVLPDQLPGNFLKTRPQHISIECLRNWNVKYVLVRSRDHSLVADVPIAGAIERFQSGVYTLFELPSYEEHFVVAPSGVHISDLVVKGDTVRFRVAGAQSGPVPLKVRAAFHPRWRATSQGKALPLARSPAHEGARHEDQLLVHAGNGQVTLRCDGWMPHEALGWGLGFLGLGLGLTPSYRPARRWGRRAGATLRRWAHVLWKHARKGAQVWGRQPVRLRFLLGALVLLSALSAALLTSASKLRLPGPLGDSARFTWVSSSGKRSPCNKNLLGDAYFCSTKDGTVALTHAQARSVGDTGEFRQVWAGMGIELPGAGALEARFTDLEQGELLTLQFATSYPVQVTVLLGSHLLTARVLKEPWAEVKIALPRQSGDAELTLLFRAGPRGGSLVFAGQIGKSP